MTENEVKFYQMLNKIDEAASNIQEQIRENYNIDSEYNAENHTLTIKRGNAIQMAQAKQFIEECQGDILFDTVFE